MTCGLRQAGIEVIAGVDIDEEAKEHDNKFVTSEKIKPIEAAPKQDFNTMKNEFSDLVGVIMQANPANAAHITAIVDKYLGKGKKVGDCSPAQSEQLERILVELRDLATAN